MALDDYYPTSTEGNTTYYSPSSPSSSMTSLGGTGGGGGGGIPLASIGLGIYQTWNAKKGIDALNKEPLPMYAATQDMLKAKERSGNLAKKGFTNVQKAAFQQDTARVLNTGYENSIRNAGGNMATALSGQNMAAKLRSLNQYAVADANQYLNNIRYDDSITRSLQELANRNTAYLMQRRQAKELAYGAAMKAGTENITNGLNQSMDVSKLMKFMA
jgi:hypothetical protein